jgi:hypothetical protein
MRQRIGSPKPGVVLLGAASEDALIDLDPWCRDTDLTRKRRR